MWGHGRAVRRWAHPSNAVFDFVELGLERAHRFERSRAESTEHGLGGTVVEGQAIRRNEKRLGVDAKLFHRLVHEFGGAAGPRWRRPLLDDWRAADQREQFGDVLQDGVRSSAQGVAQIIRYVLAVRCLRQSDEDLEAFIELAACEPTGDWVRSLSSIRHGGSSTTANTGTDLATRVNARSSQNKALWNRVSKGARAKVLPGS